MIMERLTNFSDDVTEGRAVLQGGRTEEEQLTEVHVGGLGGLKCVQVSDIILYRIRSDALRQWSVLRREVSPMYILQ